MNNKLLSLRMLFVLMLASLVKTRNYNHANFAGMVTVNQIRTP